MEQKAEPRTKNKNTIILVLIFSILAIVGALYIVFSQAPHLTYTIQSIDEDNLTQIPLTTKIGDGVVDFNLSFYDVEDKYSNIKLKGQVSFTKEFPFVSYNDTLLLTLADDKKKDDTAEIEEDGVEENWVLYQISGEISNLENRFYKLRIEDQHNNLIDEKPVDLKAIE